MDVAVMRFIVRLVVAVTLLVLGGSAVAFSSADTTGPQPLSQAAPPGVPISDYVPPIGHVFVINIENKDYEKTWENDSAAPYLSGTLRKKGVLLYNYFGTAHESLGNYLAQISGQAPDPEIQGDCQVYRDFTSTGVQDPGQYVGQGCVFPAETPTLAGQLDNAGFTWRGYMQDMKQPCRHPVLNGPDDTQQAKVGDEYATRHDPFMYFHSIIDRPQYCADHVVDLTQLQTDLKSETTTRNLSFITPDLCSDGHDSPCVDGRPGGLASIDAWMKVWIPRILGSAAYKDNGLLVITADESDGPQSDSSACCNEKAGPNSPQPGINGMGGGRVGALVLSRWVQPNTWSTTPYNHYSLLASIEDIFRLPYLGFAQPADLNHFALDVYNGYNN